MKVYGILLLLAILLFPCSGNSSSTYIPDKAYTYIPTVIKEVNNVIPTHPFPPYFLSLIEHESCVSLKSKRCWSPTSELKTSREQGVGLGQLTRAWKSDGRLRFDTLSELVRKNPRELGTLSWKNIKTRPDLQIKAIILLYKGNYNRLSNKAVPLVIDRLAFSDLAYNAGYGRVIKNRRLCGLTKGCDPSKYFNNTENYCTASKRILYGNRSACDITKHHVRDILTDRIVKYGKYYINNYTTFK